MKRRIGAVLLALALALCLLPPAADASEMEARGAQSNGQPYSIMVNRRQSTVTIYALDENGCYTVPVRAMICSTGAAGTATPKGDFSIGKKIRWNLMVGGVYAQYLSQFHNDCLFHSACYARPNPSTLLRETYNALGQPASHGCIRLQTEDAKWIYENCGTGTLVTIYDGDEPGELGKPDRMVEALTAQNFNGWDPTDPDPANPWAAQRAEGISLADYLLPLTPGGHAVLRVSKWPEGASYPTVTFRSDDPAVAVVDGTGQIRATGVGKTVVTVTCGDAVQLCTVAVTDPAVPFCDVLADTWFYPDVLYLYERGVVSGGVEFEYMPEGTLTHGEALQLLYNLAGKPEIAREEEDAAGGERVWYADAFDWAAEAGLVPDDVSEESLETLPALTKGELLDLLFRYDALRAAESAGVEAATAVRTAAAPSDAQSGSGISDWALETGLLLGDDAGELALDAAVTRAQAAALLHRYCERQEA